MVILIKPNFKKFKGPEMVNVANAFTIFSPVTYLIERLSETVYLPFNPLRSRNPVLGLLEGGNLVTHTPVGEF